MILIGSRALALRNGACLTRKPVDFDFVCTRDEANAWLSANRSKLTITKEYELPEFSKMIVEGSTNIEFELVQPGSSNQLLVQLVDADPDCFDTPFGKVPTFDMLFTIKQSHRYRKFDSVNDRVFWKTALDWHAMRSAGAKVRPEYEAFLKLREKESYAGQMHPKLNVSKEDFFTDVFKYDHDDTHRAVATLDKPAYEYYLADGEQVKTSKAKFFAVDEHTRLCGVCEEAATLAIERSKVPWDDTWSDDRAWKFALGKVCTSITSGYFREYAFTHAFDAIKLYKEQYVDYYTRFKQALAEGRVKLTTIGMTTQ